MNTQCRSMKAFSFSNTGKTEWNQNTNQTEGSITGKKRTFWELCAIKLRSLRSKVSFIMGFALSLLPPRRDLSSTYLISTSSISVCAKRESQHDRVCASVSVYSSVSVLCPWYACKCCDTITRSDGGVPYEVVNCLMWSGPRNVLQREISCLNMLYKWSARLWSSFKGVGFN